MRIMAGVGEIVQRTGDGRTGRILDGWAIERSDGVVCDCKDRWTKRGGVNWAFFKI
jgi:hypothetical protein